MASGPSRYAPVICYVATADPKKTMVPPKIEEVPPFLNFSPLRNALEKLQRSSEHYGKAVATLNLGQKPLDALNLKLAQAERGLTLPDGLPGRPWFRHQIYAPGMYTGYGVKTIPGVREAIEQKNWKQADEQIVRAGQVLEKEAAVIEEIAGEMER